jgi:hypothetical protein
MRRARKGEGSTCRRLAEKLSIAFAVPAESVSILPTNGPRAHEDLCAWEAFIQYERKPGDGWATHMIPFHVARGPVINGLQCEGTERLAGLEHVTIAIQSFDSVTQCVREGFVLVCEKNTFTAYANERSSA